MGLRATFRKGDLAIDDCCSLIASCLARRYRHWTFSDEPLRDDVEPSKMMAIRVPGEYLL